MVILIYRTVQYGKRGPEGYPREPGELDEERSSSRHKKVTPKPEVVNFNYLGIFVLELKLKLKLKLDVRKRINQ